MLDDLKSAVRGNRTDLIAAAVTTAIVTPMVHYVASFTWLEALAAAVAPLGMMFGVKLFIDGWFGAADLDADDAELVDVRLDRRGRLHGYWRRRPEE